MLWLAYQYYVLTHITTTAIVPHSVDTFLQRMDTFTQDIPHFLWNLKVHNSLI
jgi:hypothetical protein